MLVLFVVLHGQLRKGCGHYNGVPIEAFLIGTGSWVAPLPL